jgi:hypothetical protein
VVALDDAHAAQRFGEPAGDFGVDLASFAEDWTDNPEGVLQDEDESAHHGKGSQGHRRAEVHQIDKSQNGREQPAYKLHKPGADQVAHAFDVGHDAGN